MIRILHSLPAIAGAGLLIASTAAAAYSPEKLALVDRPYQGESVALSPDGHYLAYTSAAPDKLWLVMMDLNQQSRRTVLLTDRATHPGAELRLAQMRWLSANRLLLVNPDSEIISFDADNGTSLRLWNPNADGLVNTMNFRDEKYIVRPGVPRILPPLEGRPNAVLIETTAHIGAESFANAYLIDATTGEGELVNGDSYLSGQIALYGRGDMLMWPGLPFEMERWIDAPGVAFPGLIDVNRYFQSGGAGPGLSLDVSRPETIRSKMEMFLSFPPEMNGETLDLRGWPPPPRDPPPLPPSPTSLTPETGAAVSADSSSPGRMLYDRQGRPRLLYTESTKGGTRTFYYAAQNSRFFEPNRKPRSLNAALGETEKGEFLVSADNYFGERSYPLAFDFDPNVVYIASDVGRDTFGIYRLNLTTGERTEVAPGIGGIDFASGDPSEADGILVFDEYRKQLSGVRYASLKYRTYWLDPELAEIQRALDAQMPRHSVEILSWDENRQRFLVQATAEDDPGAVFIYHRDSGDLEQIFSRTPWLADQTLNASGSFTFETSDGRTLSGYLTLPNVPVLEPPPLIIYCQGGLWDRARPGYSREAEILADMGVAVMRLNYRGSAGFGRSHLLAIQQGIDTVPTEDLTAAVKWLADAKRIDPTRVLVMGEGFGGYVAQRAVQLHPEIFRAGITINAPTNLSAWARARPIADIPAMYRDGSVEAGGTIDFRSEVRADFIREARRLSGDAPERPSGVPARPLLVIESAGSGDTTPILSAIAGLGIGLRGLDVEHLRIRGDFEGGSTATRNQVFQRISDFLTGTIYNFEVNMGELRTVDPPPDEAGKRPAR